MATQTAARLPLWHTVADAYRLTIGNFGYLIRVSWVWVLVMLPVAFAFHYMAFQLGWHRMSDLSSFGSAANFLIPTLLYMPMLASIAVAWHRRLLADEVWQGRYYLRLDRTVAGYLGLALIVTATAIAPLYALVALADRSASEGWTERLVLVCLLMFAVGLFISTKIWLALPARALGRSGFGMRQAWSETNRNFWRLFVGFILCVIPVVIIAGALALLEVDWTGIEEPAVYAASVALFDLVVTFLAGMPVVSFLSLAYRRLVMSGATGPAG